MNKKIVYLLENGESKENKLESGSSLGILLRLSSSGDRHRVSKLIIAWRRVRRNIVIEFRKK